MTVIKKFLFNFPYYSFKIDKNKYNKEEIVSLCLENYYKQPVRNEWDFQSNLHHSYNDNDNPVFKKINYSLVYPLYLNAFNSLLDDLSLSKSKKKWKLDIANYNVTSKNQYMNPHHHFPAHFSGVHYIKFDKKIDKPLTFKNPFHYLLDTVDENFYKNFHNTQNNDNWMYPEVSIDIEEDDFIIFPSVMKHFIPTSNADSKRISIVTNMEYSNSTNICYS